MSKKDIETILGKYVPDFRLVLRQGNPSEKDKEYLYVYTDDIGIYITIDPNDKSFSFSFIVDMLFKLSSENMSPIDYPNHFSKMYDKFRKNVIKFLS